LTPTVQTTYRSLGAVVRIQLDVIIGLKLIAFSYRLTLVPRYLPCVLLLPEYPVNIRDVQICDFYYSAEYEYQTSTRYISG